MIDWERYRKCSVCLAEIGQPCITLSGKVVNGRPDGIRLTAERPHIARRLRSGR